VHPFVTIAIPCLDEVRFIGPCLRSVLAQDYPADRFEVLVADGGSTDGTVDALARIAAEDPRVVPLANPDRIQAAAMNVMIRRARGDVVVRMDVHCEYAPDYVRRCIEVLERTGADNVGGAQRARALPGNAFQAALCAALDSRLGVGGSHRSEHAEGWVDTVFLGAFRRGVFERVGLYDPGAVTNEDAELNQRIHAAGGRVYLSREVVVHYYPRPTFRALAKQYFRYGRGRARTLLKHRRLGSIRPLLPTALVLGALLLLATSGLQPFTPWLLGAFAALTGLEAVRVGGGGGPGRVLRVWAIFPVLYASHAAGMVTGLAHYLRRPDWTEPERLPARSADVAAA
jgi:succinoglycan biosynthesis protein ExoA